MAFISLMHWHATLEQATKDMISSGDLGLRYDATCNLVRHALRYNITHA